MTPTLRCLYLGRVPYADAGALQDELVARVRRGEADDTLLLLEHPAVITLGRSTADGHVLVSDEERRAAGIELHEAGRGGDVTFHGPGQLVGYPVIALRGARQDAHHYLRDIEAGLIEAAASYGVAASRVPGLTGVWVGDAKLAAIGVRINTGWITSHGFALNVSRDVSGFAMIVPCGLRGKAVTSLSLLTGNDLQPAEVAATVADRVAAALGYTAQWPGETMANGSTVTVSSSVVQGATS